MVEKSKNLNNLEEKIKPTGSFAILRGPYTHFSAAPSCF